MGTSIEREAMTLEQVRDDIRVHLEPDAPFEICRAWADAIDAYLSRAAEPVGELVRLGSSPYTGEYGSVFWRDNTPPPCGTKLYTHPSEDALRKRLKNSLVEVTYTSEIGYVVNGDEHLLDAACVADCVALVPLDDAMAEEKGNV